MSMLKIILYIFNVYVQMLLSCLYTKFSQGSRPVVNQHRIWSKHMVLAPKKEQFCNVEVTWQKHDHRLVTVKWSCSEAVVELAITLLCFQLDHNYFSEWNDSTQSHFISTIQLLESRTHILWQENLGYMGAPKWDCSFHFWAVIETKQ